MEVLTDQEPHFRHPNPKSLAAAGQLMVLGVVVDVELPFSHQRMVTSGTAFEHFA